MASSSKNISMPLVFVIAIGATGAMVASTVFAMAWYSYENKKIITANADAAPMHSAEYEARYGEANDAEQTHNLHRVGQADVQLPGDALPSTHYYTPIEVAMDRVVRENGGHVEHNHDEDDHGHDHDDHDGHSH